MLLFERLNFEYDVYNEHWQRAENVKKYYAVANPLKRSFVFADKLNYFICNNVFLYVTNM